MSVLLSSPLLLILLSYVLLCSILFCFAGGSNGGMLVGNMYVQRPDLFGAVRTLYGNSQI